MNCAGGIHYRFYNCLLTEQQPMEFIEGKQLAENRRDSGLLSLSEDFMSLKSRTLPLR